MASNASEPMSASPQVTITVYDTDIVGMSIFALAFLGTLSNLTVAVFTRKLKTMNNPFGKLTASQSTGEALLCAVFCFYYSPMVLFQSSWMEAASRHAGWINLICYDICIWSHLFIALNRLIAICFPLKYGILFNERNTLLLIIHSWIIPICTAIVLYKLFDCDLFYASQVWAFVFTQNEICNFISWDIDFYKDITIVIIISIVDGITIHNVIRSPILDTSTQGQAERRRREINFLKQAVLQGFIFVLGLFSYFIIAWKFQNKWITWSLTSLAWVAVHTSDGMIIILYNKEFRRLITRPMKTLDGGGVSSTSMHQPTQKASTVQPNDYNERYRAET